MIKVKDVSKKLGSFHLDKLDFEIPAGYICGLVGQNGAGKTTLLHLLLGLYKEDEGQISIDGMNYESQEKEIHNIMGTVLNEELFLQSSTLKYNANYYGKYYSNYSYERMEELLHQFQLEPNQTYGKLSRGQKLKCQYGFALACQPKVLILDEPTGNFDPEFREQFLKSLQEFIADGNHTVILASHLTDDLDKLCDFLIYLEKGKQIYAGDMEYFRSGYRVVHGEKYKIKLLDKNSMIALEEKPYGSRALVEHKRWVQYDSDLQVTYPTIEEFMYFYSKRGQW